ncbi:MAG TPA: polysaccharide deacetylase [Peptococcaceae bacterium]|nr:MAG: Polysaccharide deacetylase [Moorella sp. 60_41]HBT47805.1 polysaccharide deacetylase [Peptococcaceae bacterium]
MYVLYWQRRRVLMFLVTVVAVVFAGMMVWRWLQGEVAPVSRVQPIYQGDVNKKAVALAFNVDWGEEFLPGILQTLSRHQAKATFFITGQWAVKFPDLVRQMAREGHEIGNHGYTHQHVDNLSREENRQDIKKAEGVLADITGRQPVLYAPPYGESKPHVVAAAADLGYKFIMWTVNTGDYLPGTTAEDIVKMVVSHSQNGAIVLLHPTRPTAEALGEVINQLRKRGYELTTVSEVL